MMPVPERIKLFVVLLVEEERFAMLGQGDKRPRDLDEWGRIQGVADILGFDSSVHVEGFHATVDICVVGVAVDDEYGT